MQTKSPKTPRYKRAITRLQSGAARLQRMTAITPDEYYDHEFALGCKFLDLFWQDMDDEATIAYWKNELLTNKRHVYWAWFINQKRQCELRFVNDYTEIDDLNTTDYGIVRAQAMARKEYYLEMRCLINSDKLHHRFQNHIIQLELFTKAI